MIKEKSNEQRACPNCGEPINVDAVMCRFCGCGISAQHFFECPYCSEMVRIEASVCRFCKSKLPTSGNAPKVQNAKPSASPAIPKVILKNENVPDTMKAELEKLDQVKEEPLPSVQPPDSPLLAQSAFAANYELIREREKSIISKLRESYCEAELNEETQTAVRAEIRELVNKDDAPLTIMEKGILLQNVLDEVFGFGPLGPILRDPSVGDICINSFDAIYVEVRRVLRKTTVSFENNAHLLQTINKITSHWGKTLSQDCPIINGRLPNGSRINATWSTDGPTMTIKCFGEPFLSLGGHVEHNAFPLAVGLFLKACVQAKLNILISGAPGSGRTMLLQAMATQFGKTERVITVEEKSEFRLRQENWVRLERNLNNSEIGLPELVETGLQMRPDRLIVSQLDDAEAFVLLKALHSGLRGALSTITADSVHDAISKLETILRACSSTLNGPAAKRLIGESLNLVVQVKRFNDGRSRVVEICELHKHENGEELGLRPIYRQEAAGLDPQGHVTTRQWSAPLSAQFLERLALADVSIDKDCLN
jgi:pilus assembly protein CpaF